MLILAQYTKSHFQAYTSKTRAAVSIMLPVSAVVCKQSKQQFVASLDPTARAGFHTM